MATIQSVKDKIQGLIDKSNEATGGSDTDLTSAIDNLIANQGGGEVPREKSVNFWDYDGTLLYSYTLAEARALTSLPPLPTYENETRFYASDWTKTLSEVQAVFGFLDVTVKLTCGTPTETSTYKYCQVLVVDTALVYDKKITLRVSKTSTAGTAYVDWGDGAKASMFISTSSTYTLSHTYPSRKKYVIVIRSTVDNIRLGNGSNAMVDIQYVLLSAYTDEGATLMSYAFSFCGAMRFVYIAKPGTNTYILNKCYGLHTLICGTLNSANAYADCHSLSRLVINYTENALPNIASLKVLMYTDSSYPIITYGNSVPQVLFLTAPSVITQDRTKATFPTTNPIYVPDDLVDSYKADSSWDNNKNCIYPISSYTDE